MTNEPTSEHVQHANIFAAIVGAQGEFENPKRTKTVSTGQYSFDYAPLDAILAYVRPILRRHGLAVVQRPCTVEGQTAVLTQLVHESGEVFPADPVPFIVPAKNDAQGVGGATTYGRRYQLTSLLGLAGESDEDAPAQRAKPKAGKKEEATSKPDVPGRASQPQMKAIFALAKRKGIDEQQLRDFCGKNYGIESLTELTKGDGSNLIEELNKLAEAKTSDDTGGDVTDAEGVGVA